MIILSFAIDSASIQGVGNHGVLFETRLKINHSTNTETNIVISFTPLVLILI